MESKWWFAILFMVVIFIGLLALLFISPLSSPPSYDFETCNTLKDSGGAHNIVFISEEENAKKYMNYFLSQSPFNSYKDSFNFYYIDSYQPKCELYKGVAFLCYSRDLIKKASACPNDIIVVLKEGKSSIRSSAYMNVLSLNTNVPKSVFVHEFGHAFANLADEYTPAHLPRGAENCQSGCEEFEECFQGCSKSSYYRSIDKGVMRSLSVTEFGNFNNDLILEQIKPSSKITGSVIEEFQDCQSQEYYLIQGNYKDEMEIVSKSLEKGCVSGNGAGQFKIQLKDSEDTEIFSDDFNPELIFTDSQKQDTLEGGPIKSDIDFYIKIPIVEKTEKVQISLDENVLIEETLYDVGRRPCKNE